MRQTNPFGRQIDVIVRVMLGMQMSERQFEMLDCFKAFGEQFFFFCKLIYVHFGYIFQKFKNYLLEKIN